VSIEATFRSALLELVPEIVAAVRAELGHPRMRPIKETPISYRRILDAERAGELHVYRIGHAALVDESELYDWIRKKGVEVERTDEPADEIGELISLGDQRRRVRRAD
jgi:hypothetical protein